MKLEYTTFKDGDLFTLTDFSCQPSLELLRKKGLYKIVWCREHAAKLMIDGYAVNLKKDQVIFCTPLNVMLVEQSTEGIISFVFNKEFFVFKLMMIKFRVMVFYFLVLLSLKLSL